MLVTVRLLGRIGKKNNGGNGGALGGGRLVIEIKVDCQGPLRVPGEDELLGMVLALGELVADVLLDPRCSLPRAFREFHGAKDVWPGDTFSLVPEADALL